MILLVDRDPISADSIAYFLETAGHQVSTMFGTEGLVDRVAALSPQAVLMEVILSGANGISLTEALGRDPRTSTVPVILASFLDVGERAAKAGAVAFLLKPVDRRTLMSVVANAVNAGGRSA